MRLIDADKLRKKAQWMEMPDNQGINFYVRAVSVSSIDIAITIDAVPKEQHLARCKEMYEQGKLDALVEAVPVVRCRECQSFQANEIAAPETGTCWNCEMVRQFDDFCSYGERKDGEG